MSLFPKQEKFSIGNKIESVIIETLEYALSASYKQKDHKNEILIKASDKIDLLKILIRLAYQTKSLNNKNYILLEQRVIEVGKIMGGWIKSIN